MIKLLFKRLLPSLIGLAVVVLAALWLYGFVGVKAGCTCQIKSRDRVDYGKRCFKYGNIGGFLQNVLHIRIRKCR